MMLLPLCTLGRVGYGHPYLHKKKGEKERKCMKNKMNTLTLEVYDVGEN